MPNIQLSVGDLLSQLSSPDFFEREEAVKQLARIKEDEAVAGLVMALEDEDRGIRESAAEHLVKIGGEIAARLLIKFLAHHDISVRNLAAELLVNIGSEGLPALSETLQDPDHDIRKFILDTMGLIRDRSVVSQVHQMLDDPNENVACSAAEALGMMGSSESVEPLVKAFEKHIFLRPQAAEALGRIGDQAAFAGLKKFLNTDDMVVLYSVIEAIGHLKHPAGVKIMTPFLDHSDQMIVDAAIAASIRSVRSNDRAVFKELPQEKFKKFLLDSLKSNNPSKVHFALRELHYWQGPDIVAALVVLLKNSDDELVQQIAEAIKNIGPEAIEVLIGQIQDAPEGEQVKIINALAVIEEPKIIPEVEKLVTSDNPDVRNAVAIALGKSGSRDSIPSLQKLLKDPVGHVRSAAIKSIGWVGNEKDVNWLVECLDDRFSDVREAAMGAMILIGGNRVIQTFTKDLNHQSPERQHLATVALGMIGEDETREPLIQAVSHSDPAVRRSAIESLVRIGNLEDVDAIRMALSDEDPLVRKAAITALVNLLGTKAVDNIKLLLDDDDMWVRYHTIDTIGSLKDSRYTELILPYLDDEQDIIKIAAVKALAGIGDQSCLEHLQLLSTEGNTDLAVAVEEATRALMEIANG